MALAPGTRLGPHEITAKIGEGGMGEVYRASDTELKRGVAIKVLPAALGSDPDRLARFQREAQVLAALNHPNIAHIHGLERGAGVMALVMELVEGPTLADRIAAGPLPLEEARSIALQITEALESAHAQGIIHRDLKPSNIKVRPDGTVKVLDFGLAKAIADPVGTPGEPGRLVTQSPTITSPALMTSAGVVIGTAAYMSPEQARGKPADKRSDIWAFGCVTFEMLAGSKPFDGDEVADVLANVIAKEPAWHALPPLPAALKRTLVRCLTKDPRQRLHDIADVRLELQDTTADGDRPQVQRRRPLPWLWLSLASGIALLAGVALGAALWRQPVVATPATRLLLDAAPAEEITTSSVLDILPGGGRRALEWSPSGEILAFVGVQDGTRHIFLRDLAQGDARLLQGTRGASALAFSPDGQSIAFWAGGELRRVRVDGGPVARISPAVQLTGLAWGPSRIIFTTRYAMFEVSPDGGEPRALTQQNMRRSAPFLLPGDTALLYTEYGKPFTSGDERVMVRRLSGDGAPALLLDHAADARYLPTGHLAFIRQGTLFVVAFDAQALQVRGSPVAMQSEIAQASAAWFADDLTLAGQFAISPQGTLAYVPGREAALPISELVRIDRQGGVTGLGAPPNAYRERVEVSPDGSTLAVTIQSKTGIRLLRYDMARGTLAPATTEQSDSDTIRPVWSTDGRIAAQTSRAGGSYPIVISPDGAIQAETPLPQQTQFAPSAWIPGRRALIGHRAGDLWTYEPDATGERWTRLSENPETEHYPHVSPDGKWLTYASDVSGRDQVYVRAYPGSGAAIPVSIDGGRAPRWTPRWDELVYVQSAPVGSGEPWHFFSVSMLDPTRPGRPRELFSNRNTTVPLDACASTACYSISPDGQSYYTLRLRPRETPRVTSVRLVVNWFEEIRRLAGSGN